MRRLEDCPSKDRFLLSDTLFTDSAIDIWQLESRKRVKALGLEKNESYYRYVDWQPKTNEIALFTLYAFADFDIPKKFDCFFDLANPGVHELVNCTLTQSVHEAWHPLSEVEHGHKHLCVFTFNDEVPSLIKNLHEQVGKFYEPTDTTFTMGICDYKDYPAIKEGRESKS